MINYQPSLKRLAKLAEGRSGLLASVLAKYKQQEQLSDQQLATFLNCTVEDLPHLALCGIPREAPHFREDVELIADHVQVSSIMLAKLIRSTKARAALSEMPAQPSSLLMAARDRDDVQTESSADSLSAQDDS